MTQSCISCSQGRIFSYSFPGGFYQNIYFKMRYPRGVISPTRSFSPEEFVDGTSPIKPHNLSRLLNLLMFSISVRKVIAVIYPTPGIDSRSSIFSLYPGSLRKCLNLSVNIEFKPMKIIVLSQMTFQSFPKETNLHFGKPTVVTHKFFEI